MPDKLPSTSGKEVIRALERLGFSAVRQRGSHVIMRRGADGCSVPSRKTVKKNTLATLLKQAGISRKEFLAAYKNR